MGQVFVSYSRRNREIVDRIVGEMDRANMDVWIDREDIKAGNIRLRPGGLICLLEKNTEVFTNILFLHTDSGTDPEAYRRRQVMFQKIWSMKKALERMDEQQGPARLIALDDLNTMGRKGGPNGGHEIQDLDTQAKTMG